MSDKPGELVLCREVEEILYIRVAGVEVALRVASISSRRVRLAFRAPPEVAIYRAECDPKRNNLPDTGVVPASAVKRELIAAVDSEGGEPV